MDEALIVKPWKRYGKDRLYVSDAASGRSLGFQDRADGCIYVQDEADRSAVIGALGLQLPQPRPPVDAYRVVLDRLATDLGANAAGHGARVMAEQQRRQAPVRTLVARALGVHTDERAWRVGAKGEQIVGRELERLSREGWVVVHDVPVGNRGANIDHVVLGPAGAFTVNSKWHMGKSVWVGGATVMVDGQRQPYVRNARHEAARASRLLSSAYGREVPVIGIVAILADRWTVRAQPEDGCVLVTTPRAARRHVQSLPPRYTGKELDRLVRCARRSTTWQP